MHDAAAKLLFQVIAGRAEKAAVIGDIPMLRNKITIKWRFTIELQRLREHLIKLSF